MHFAFQGFRSVDSALTHRRVGIDGSNLPQAVQRTAPMRRTVTPEEVGNVAAFMCSDLASGITGEITYVDSGYNILGMAELGGDVE